MIIAQPQSPAKAKDGLALELTLVLSNRLGRETPRKYRIDAPGRRQNIQSGLRETSWEMLRLRRRALRNVIGFHGTMPRMSRTARQRARRQSIVVKEMRSSETSLHGIISPKCLRLKVVPERARQFYVSKMP